MLGPISNDPDGVLSISDADLLGSADDYLIGTDYADLSSKLYAVKFTRGQCLAADGWIRIVDGEPSDKAQKRDETGMWQRAVCH